MAVTTGQIRNMLNQPRGLNNGTITEYITIRTEEITQIARSTTLYSISNSISDTQKESAIKFLVAIDCLRVMIDTIPSYVPENQQRANDIRLSAQLKSFEKQAERILSQIREKGGTAFAIDNTETRQE